MKRLSPREIDWRKKRKDCVLIAMKNTLLGISGNTMFLIEAVEEIEEEEDKSTEIDEERDLGISIHALARKVIYQTLKDIWQRRIAPYISYWTLEVHIALLTLKLPNNLIVKWSIQIHYMLLLPMVGKWCVTLSV